MGKVHQCIQAVCDGFMVGKFEGSFAKDLSISLKSRAEALHPSHFATLLQNNEKVFEDLRESFFPNVPLVLQSEEAKFPVALLS